MTGKGGQEEEIVFDFTGKKTDRSVNLDADLIELGRESGDRTPGPRLFPCHKNHEDVTS